VIELPSLGHSRNDHIDLLASVNNIEHAAFSGGSARGLNAHVKVRGWKRLAKGKAMRWRKVYDNIDISGKSRLPVGHAGV
jgi:hypothetical protein